MEYPWLHCSPSPGGGVAIKETQARMTRIARMKKMSLFTFAGRKFLARKNSMYGMKAWRDESLGWKNKGCTDEKMKGRNAWDEKLKGCTDEPMKRWNIVPSWRAKYWVSLAGRQTVVLFVSFWRSVVSLRSLLPPNAETKVHRSQRVV